MNSDLTILIPRVARYEREPIPDAVNALIPWAEACDRFRPCNDGHTLESPTEFDTIGNVPELESHVSSETAISLVDEGINRGRLQFPEIYECNSGFWESHRLVRVLRSIGQQRIINFGRFVEERNHSAAAKECVGLLRMGELICSAEGMVSHYLVGAWLRDAGINGIHRLAKENNTSTNVARYLLAQLKASENNNDGFVQSMRMNLCCFTLPRLDHLQEKSDLESLIGTLIDLYYDLGPTRANTSNCSPYREATMQERSNDRKLKLMSLLSGHPHPFKKESTVRLVGQNVSRFIQRIENKKSWLYRARSVHREVIYYYHNRLQQKLVELWPPTLQPSFPLNLFGEDKDAASARASVKQHTNGGELDFALDSLSRVDLEVSRRKLRRFDNPIGLLLAQSLVDKNLAKLVLGYRRSLKVAKIRLMSGLCA